MLYSGKAHKIGDHIDTDAIIPARFLVTTDPAKLGEQCLSGLEPNWVRRVQAGDILVAGRNFGCGSSREHAPVAILGAGMPVVIAHSFARIFFRNSYNMGLLLLEVGDQTDIIQNGDQLEIDTEAGTIKIVNKNSLFNFRPLPESMSGILMAGGLVAYVRQRLEREPGWN